MKRIFFVEFHEKISIKLRETEAAMKFCASKKHGLDQNERISIIICWPYKFWGRQLRVDLLHLTIFSIILHFIVIKTFN